MGYGNHFSTRNVNVIVNGKELMNERMQSATYFHFARIWGGSEVHIYYSLHTWNKAKQRWSCCSKELFMNECIEILDNDAVDSALVGVEYGRPIALLDDKSGRVLWFRLQFNDRNKKIEIFLHSVFYRSFNDYPYIYIQDKNTFCIMLMKNGDVVSGIENIPDFRQKQQKGD